MVLISILTEKKEDGNRVEDAKVPSVPVSKSHPGGPKCKNLCHVVRSIALYSIVLQQVHLMSFPFCSQFAHIIGTQEVKRHAPVAAPHSE